MDGYLQQNLSDNKVNTEIYFQYLQMTLVKPYEPNLSKIEIQSTVFPTNPCATFREWHKWFHSQLRKSNYAKPHLH